MDSGGISPVIGALLLLAIVAILAAVLGTFALGFDDQLMQPAPQVALEVSEYDAAGTGNGRKPYLEIHHRAGDIADGTKVSFVTSLGTRSPGRTCGRPVRPSGRGRTLTSTAVGATVRSTRFRPAARRTRSSSNTRGER